MNNVTNNLLEIIVEGSLIIIGILVAGFSVFMVAGITVLMLGVTVVSFTISVLIALIAITMLVAFFYMRYSY